MNLAWNGRYLFLNSKCVVATIYKLGKKGKFQAQIDLKFADQKIPHFSKVYIKEVSAKNWALKQVKALIIE